MKKYLIYATTLTLAFTIGFGLFPSSRYTKSKHLLESYTFFSMTDYNAEVKE